MRRATSWLAGFAPTTWMSIGAGRPKLRIWLTMSAAEKKNVAWGNAAGSCRRSSRTYANVLPGALSETRISPSADPVVAPSLNARLTPPTGSPMFARIRPSTSGVIATAGRVAAGLTAEQVVDHGGHQRSRQEVGRKHGEHDGQGQRREQELHDAAQEEDGHEDDADRERRDQRGRGDLLRPVEDGLPQAAAEAEVAVHVLERDRRIVDEDADGQPEAAERHDVDRVAESTEQDERGEDRQRDRDRHDDRAAPAAEEHEDHQSGQHRRDGALANDAVEGGADEDRLIEERRDPELRG